MPRRFPLATGPIAGALAGALVGLVDGTRAALLVGAEGRAVVASAVLAAAADALIGALGGALVELVARLAVWGRRAEAPRAARAGAWAAAGAAAAAAAGGNVVWLAARNNRFLAAGLASLTAVGVGAAAALLAPALARAVSGRWVTARVAAPSQRGRSRAAALLAVPAVAALLAGVVFLLLWKTRSPLRGAALHAREIRVGVAAFVGPWLLAAAARARSRLGWAAAAGLCALLFVAPAAAALALTWTDNLRFAPWIDIAVGAAIAVVAAALALGLRDRLPRRNLARVALAIAAAGLAVAVLLPISASESARKAGAARTGLVAPLLATGRQMLDFDHDGYAGLLGGGDCDDSDPNVHPGAVDLPGDGVDDDCDGHDAPLPVLPPPARFAAVPDAVPRDLNVILLTIDTLRADHLGCYGYGRPTSPELDRLAADATLFENGFAHAPSTRYSMPAIATGRWPSAIDWDESIWWPRIGAGMRTIGQAMHDAGYFTGGIFSFNYFARSDRRGFERGMDFYDTSRAALHVAVNGPMESRGSSSREVADDAIAFIEAHRDRKFFLWLHFYDPHLSYEPHAEVPSFGTARADLYDGEIRFTDLHVGRLLARLRQLGLYDRTVIAVTGDHGEGLGEHGITEHGFDLYAPQTKVPFIVRVPGLPAQRLTAPVGHVDLLPTLANLARGREEPGFLGRSLVPALAGDRAWGQDGAVFQEVSSERGKKRALVTATLHLIWNWTPDNTTECYDRRSDPAENRDLWGRGESAAECARLKSNLEALVSSLALPPGYADKIAAGVIPAGAPDPRPAHPMDARLGDRVRVFGADIAPAEVSPGGEVTVTTYFQSLQRLGDRWRLFFHLDGPPGRPGNFRNLDHVPVEGLMPVERWRPGQRIRDRHRVSIFPGMPAGVYTLWVGAFRAGERLPVTPRELTDGHDRLRLGTFVVR